MTADDDTCPLTYGISLASFDPKMSPKRNFRLQQV